jgi:hypothetical protein
LAEAVKAGQAMKQRVTEVLKEVDERDRKTKTGLERLSERLEGG